MGFIIGAVLFVGSTRKPMDLVMAVRPIGVNTRLMAFEDHIAWTSFFCKTLQAASVQ